MALTTRVYRPRRWERVFPIVFTLFGLLILVIIFIEVLRGGREPSDLVIPLLLTAGGGVFIFGSFHNVVSLSETTIEMRGLMGTVVLPLDKIAGRRKYVSRGDGDTVGNVTYMVIEPNDDRFPRLDIQDVYRFDDSFYEWFNGLTDLDALDKKRKQSGAAG